MENRLYEIRIENKMSQRKFAREVGISTNTLIEAETGRRKLTDRQMTLICNRFFLNKDWLELGQGEKYTLTPKSQKALELFGRLGMVGQDVAIALLKGLLEIQDTDRE